MSSYKYAAKDTGLELQMSMNSRELPKEHWCRGCCWAKVEPPVFICPFIAGSCARLPETMENPDPELLKKKIRAVRQRAAAKDEAQRSKDGRMTAAGEAQQQRRKPNNGELYILEGEVHTLPEWAERAGMSDTCLRRRIRRGMSLREALEKPVDEKYIIHGQRREPDDFIRAMREAAWVGLE